MFRLVEKNGVKFLESDNILSHHGFSTRMGGVSELEYTRGLNLAYARGDNDATVRENVELFAKAIGVDSQKIISVPQIHSNLVRVVDDSHAGEGTYRAHTFECDGYVTESKGLPIGIKTADCVPILLEARSDSGEVIAVSAVHAGWRGTAAKILQVAVEKLALLGVGLGNIYIAIGPCIDECCYEVGNDFANEIKEKLGQNYEDKFIKRKPNGSLCADLKGMNLEILLTCGVPLENIDVCSRCTCCEPEFFYSHRRQKGIRGSMLNIICK